MNLVDTLSNEHSKSQTMRIVRWIGNDKQRFKQLMDIFLGTDKRLSQRSAWALSYCAEMHPELILPWLNRLISNLGQPNTHPAIDRNTLRFLQFMDVPKRFHGQLIHTCFQMLQKADTPIAVRAFAMTVAFNIVQQEPEMARELKLLIEEWLPNASPGEKSRAKRTLKDLDQLIKK